MGKDGVARWESGKVLGWLSRTKTLMELNAELMLVASVKRGNFLRRIWTCVTPAAKRHGQM